MDETTPQPDPSLAPALSCAKWVRMTISGNLPHRSQPTVVNRHPSKFVMPDAFYRASILFLFSPLLPLRPDAAPLTSSSDRSPLTTGGDDREGCQRPQQMKFRLLQLLSPTCFSDFPSNSVISSQMEVPAPFLSIFRNYLAATIIGDCTGKTESENSPLPPFAKGKFNRDTLKQATEKQMWRG